MRRAEILTALGFIAFALAIVAQARSVGSGWSVGQPQPGFLPFWLGLLLGICGVVVLGQALLSKTRSPLTFFEGRTGLASVLKVSVSAIGMLVLIYLVGFYTATMVYVFAYTRFVGRHSWVVAVALRLVISFGSVYAFERALGMLLPRVISRLIPRLVCPLAAPREPCAAVTGRSRCWRR